MIFLFDNAADRKLVCEQFYKLNTLIVNNQAVDNMIFICIKSFLLPYVFLRLRLCKRSLLQSPFLLLVIVVSAVLEKLPVMNQYQYLLQFLTFPFLSCPVWPGPFQYSQVMSSTVMSTLRLK